MKFETIKKDNKKKIIIGVSVIVLVGIVLVIGSSFAKYRSVKTIHLVNSTVNYTTGDFNIVAMYKNDGTSDEAITSMPGDKYTINTTKSICTVNGVKDNNITLEYKNSLLNILNISQKGTKCTIYFDKIKDTEIPVISSVSKSVTKTSITVTVSASDNEGVTEYLYGIDSTDSNTYKSSTSTSYTFDNLAANSSHEIYIIAKDESGNSSVVYNETIAVEPDGITILSSGTSANNAELYYSYNGTTSTLTTGENWILPIGATLSVKPNDGSVESYSKNLTIEFYSNTDGTGTKLGNVGACAADSYTITGNEKSYKAYWTCFTGETELLAYDEKKKKKLKRKVKDFKVGDKLYTYFEKEEKFITTKIKRIEEVKTKDIYAIHLENGEVIRCSGGHSFYVAGASYMMARELNTNMSLIGIDKNYKIVKIEREHYKEDITLYNLYLDNNSNAFVTSAKVLSYMLVFGSVAISKKSIVFADSGCLVD